MPSNQPPNWQSINGLVNELKACDNTNITTASIAMGYICIDTLANLSRDIEKPRVTRSDFIAWVDNYLKGHSEQPYQYRGKDVYAARCALLHKYGSEADLHSQDSDIIRFAYHDGGQHKYSPNEVGNLALIGAKSFVNDVVLGVERFLEDCKENIVLRELVETRLPQLLLPMNIN
jgi:hypothetical protein